MWAPAANHASGIKRTCAAEGLPQAPLLDPSIEIALRFSSVTCACRPLAGRLCIEAWLPTAVRNAQNRGDQLAWGANRKGYYGVRSARLPIGSRVLLNYDLMPGRMSENGGRHANQRRKLALERCCQLFVRY